jgi:hypothetical protein
VGCHHFIDCISATARVTSPAFAILKRKTKLKQSEGPTVWPVVSAVNCGGKTAFSGAGIMEQMTVPPDVKRPAAPVLMSSFPTKADITEKII